MNVYKKLFLDLAVYIKHSNQKKLYFAFPDPESLRYNREKLVNWIADDRVAANAYVVVCPAVEIFPFSVCGIESKKPVVYFCEDSGFAKQNETNSRWIVGFIRRYIHEHQGLLKRLIPKS
jgi:hypothetical protein